MGSAMTRKTIEKVKSVTVKCTSLVVFTVTLRKNMTTYVPDAKPMIGMSVEWTSMGMQL